MNISFLLRQEIFYFSKVGGTSRIRVCSVWLVEIDVPACTFNPSKHFAIRRLNAGRFKQPFTSPRSAAGSSDTAMPILPMFRSLFTERRCASPRLAPSTALCEKPTASASVR